MVLQETTETHPLPRESHGQRNLEGYSPWGQKELEMTERLILNFHRENRFLGVSPSAGK